MFKAKLIEGKEFYRAKRWLLWLMPLPGLLPILANFSGAPVWVAVIAFVLLAVYVYVIWRNKRMLNRHVGKHEIVLSEQGATITTADTKQTKAHFALEELTHVAAPTETAFEEMPISAAINGTDGTFTLVLYPKAGEPVRYDFLVDSHYMSAQLEKVLAAWRARGVEVRPLRNGQLTATAG